MNTGPGPGIDDPDGPPGLDVASILDIHRDPDGYIAFTRKPGPGTAPRLDKNGKPCAWDHLFAIRADQLRDMLPALAGWLTHDAYMGVNSFYRAAPWMNKLTGLPDVWREEKHLRSLAACYVDIDCGRPESDQPGAALHWRQAQHLAEYLADTGAIPPPSIKARSGRGLYLFWLLCDESDPTKLPHAWPEKVELYKACNRALNERLRSYSLPADRAAIDAARVLRVPGSVHRKTMRTVRYVLELDEHGRGFVYTLAEIAAALDLPALDLPAQARSNARPAQYRKVKNPGSAPLRSHGTLKLNALRAQDLLTISHARGGYLKRGVKYPDNSTSPGRRFILTLYANFLRGSGTDQAAALDAVRAMAATMRPPWPDEPGDPTPEKLVDDEYTATKRRRWSNEKLCALLSIDADRARELDLRTIRPRTVALDADQARPTKQDIVQERRAWLRHYLHEHPNPGGGGRWTCRKVQDALSAFSPHPWNNPNTANEDLNAIGYHMAARSRGGRKRKDPGC